MDDIAIDVRQLHKTFGTAPALRDVSLQVRRGEMVALLGASGSGKSTLLRHLDGQQHADAGTESSVAVLGRRVQRGGRIARDIRASQGAQAPDLKPARKPMVCDILERIEHGFALHGASSCEGSRRECVSALNHALQCARLAEDAVRLRRWDDLARTPRLPTPRLAYHLALVDEVRVPGAAVGGALTGRDGSA